MNPPQAKAGGFLAQEAPQTNGLKGLTPSTPAGTEPARFVEQSSAVPYWFPIGTVCALGSRNARQAPYPIAWRPFALEAKSPSLPCSAGVRFLPRLKAGASSKETR
ncbi:hypothetical protein GCM10010307_69670 [Streptomyces vastus]|uniref:Uncharacterized protein n=1 Tax=Streptomyces vastus TaxID=285451 RepID=A0ABP6DZG6_9ACTN